MTISFFLNDTEMIPGIECQQAAVVAGTEKIKNFAGTLTLFVQEHLQHLKKEPRNQSTNNTWFFQFYIYSSFLSLYVSQYSYIK